MVTGAASVIRANKDVVKEMRFVANHIDRKSNEIIFTKCIYPRCKHCFSNPIISKKAWEDIKERNFKWPNPILSQQFPDHYKTFIEIDTLDESNIITSIIDFYNYTSLSI